MSSVELRPRFRYTTALSHDEIADRIRAYQKEKPVARLSSATEYHVTIRIPKTDQHYWSPQLDISMEEDEDGLFLRCLVGPSPSVWTKFVFFYAVIGFVALIGSILGMSQMMIEKMPTGFIAFPIAIAAFVVVYSMGQTGKQLGRDETILLKNFFEEAMLGDLQPYR